MPTIPFSTIIAKERTNPEAAQFMDEEGKKMDAAVQLMLTREETHLNQEEDAEQREINRATV